MFEAVSGIANSLIAAAGLVFVAYLTFVLNKRIEIGAAWRAEKLSYYKEFIDALAVNIQGEATVETHRRFARASNNLLLIGSKKVLAAHHAYREHIRVSNSNRDYDLDGPLLATLLNALRNDMDMPGGDLIDAKHARLWAAGVKSEK